jgi:hypothetical protein
MDWAFDHLTQTAVRFAAAFGLEGFEQLGIPVVPLGGIDQRLNETAGSVGCTLGVQVHTQADKDFRRIALKLAYLILGDLTFFQIAHFNEVALSMFIFGYHNGLRRVITLNKFFRLLAALTALCLGFWVFTSRAGLINLPTGMVWTQRLAYGRQGFSPIHSIITHPARDYPSDNRECPFVKVSPNRR